VTYASALEEAARLRLASQSPALAAGLGLRQVTLLDRVRHVRGVAPARARGSRWPAGLVTLLVLLGVGLAVQWALTTEARRATAAPAATYWAAEAGLGDAPATEQQMLLQEAALPPGKAVVLETRRPWRQSGWMREFFQLAECLTVDPEPGYGRVIINEPQGYQALVRYFALPVDTKRYPILVLNYRASNAQMKNCNFWLDDGQGPDFGGIVAVSGSEMVADGQIHEVRKDLRTLKPKGPISGLGLFLQCADQAPMTYDLIGLRFEVAPDATPVAPIRRGAPVQIRVVDQQGQPVPGATVTVDPERRNFALVALTDGYGQVAVAPLETESGGHALRVEGPGYMAADLASWSPPADGSPFTVTLVRAVSYGGTVMDEKSQPVAGAGVKLYIANSRTGCEVLTDAAGRWQTPPLPADATELYSLRVNHPDYLPKRLGRIYSEAGPGTVQPTLAQLRQQRAVITVEQAFALTGRVVDSQGQPIAGARVAVAGPCVAVPGYSNVQKWYTDAAGNFRLSPLQAAEAMVVARSKDYAPAVIKTAAGPGTAPLEFCLTAGEEMSVRLVDGQGRPVTKAFAYLQDWDGVTDWMFLSLVLSPDAAGRVVWKHAPRGRLTFDVKTPDFLNESGSPHTFTVTVPMAEEQQFVLSR
jgi:protocatechuate 3,4-dioxygenase beta subunit